MERTLMRTVRDTHKLWMEYMKSIAVQAGIPDSYRMVLSYLFRNPGASQKDIAEFRNISTASISQTVKEMELTGYITKETNPEDQRYVKLYLTEKGETCAEEIHEKIQNADEMITRLLTPEKEEEMIRLLDELSEIIEKELPRC